MGDLASRIESLFLPRLTRFGLDTLEASRATICALWPDLRIAYVNPRWAGFAEENGATALAAASALGRSYLEPLAGPLRPFYERLLVGALGCEDRVDHDYECSSAESYRVYRMSVYPLADRGGLVVAHTCVIARPHDREPTPLDESIYRNEGGVFVQCAHCRRTRRAAADEWDWVPDLLTNALDISHGLCPLCVGYYYGDLLGASGTPE